MRPQWDEQVLKRLGTRKILCDEAVWKKVWSKEELVNFSATPMFEIIAIK